MADTSDIIDSIEVMLDKIDTQLDGVISYMDNLTDLLNQEIEAHREIAQEIVNEKVQEFSTKLTNKLQPIRDKITDIFSSQFAVVKEKVNNYIAPISAFVTINWANGTITPNIPSIDDLLNVVTGIISMLVPTAAVEFAAKFATKIFPKILTVSNKIQTIATYKPQIDVPDIEVPPLDVNIDPITLQDIMGEE